MGDSIAPAGLWRTGPEPCFAATRSRVTSICARLRRSRLKADALPRRSKSAIALLFSQASLG
jgi:hypothetical protein